MHAQCAEFMVAADVVEMGVARNAGERALGDQRHMGAQAEMAEARIEQQVAVAPAHMPHVAAVEGLDPRFVDQRHAIGEADRLVPLGRTDAAVPSLQSFSTITWAGSMASITCSPGRTAVSAGSRASRSMPLACGRHALEAALVDDVRHLALRSRRRARHAPGGSPLAWRPRVRESGRARSRSCRSPPCPGTMVLSPMKVAVKRVAGLA